MNDKIDFEKVNFEHIRNFGMFYDGTYRIYGFKSIQECLDMRKIIGGTWKWNEEIGDYIVINKEHPLWGVICKMKS